MGVPAHDDLPGIDWLINEWVEMGWMSRLVRLQFNSRNRATPKHPLRLGDYAKGVVSFLCLTFLSCLALHETGHLNIFAESYQRDGFCVANNQTSPAMQGHAIAFYADALMSIFMLGLVHIGQTTLKFTEPALRPIKKNALSLFGHGCGHLYLAAMTDLDSQHPSHIFEGLTTKQRMVAFVAFSGVWYGFMRDARRSVAVTCAFALFHNVLQVFFLPSRFFFVHVLIAVLMNSAVRGLLRSPKEKDVYYDMEAILVDVPILLAMFVEAVACDSFLIHHGGHVWFDMVVPVMFTVYYLILCLNRFVRTKRPLFQDDLVDRKNTLVAEQQSKHKLL